MLESTFIMVDNETIKVARLLQPGDTNTKLRKSAGRGFITCGLSLAPHKSAGVGNVCPHASAGCISACLDHQGLASVWPTIRRARRAKTVAFYRERQWFLNRLAQELANQLSAAESQELGLAARLNVFSDIPWETLGIVDAFPQIQFYDYTKNPRRAGLVRPNYWVTFSRSETNETQALELLRERKNVSVVFADQTRPYVGNLSKLQQLPKRWNGFEVVDGDETDLRFTDPRGRKYGKVIGLRLKAHSTAERSQAIASGFAVEF